MDAIASLSARLFMLPPYEDEEAMGGGGGDAEAFNAPRFRNELS